MMLGPTLNPTAMRQRAIVQRLRNLGCSTVYVTVALNLPGGEPVRQLVALDDDQLEQRDPASVLQELLECLLAQGERRVAP